MNKKTKKGFTIVELVIVIAVIAILAAVLIPTFASVIKKANLSNDQSMIRNMNTTLAMEVIPESKFDYAGDAILALNNNGFVGKFNPYSAGYHYGYHLETNTMYLIDGDKNVVYPSDKVALADLWLIWQNKATDKVDGVSKYVSLVNIDNSGYYGTHFAEGNYTLDLSGHYIGYTTSTLTNVTVVNGVLISGAQPEEGGDVTVMDRAETSEVVSGTTENITIVENKVFDCSQSDMLEKVAITTNIKYVNCHFYNMGDHYTYLYNRTFENCTFVDAQKYIFNMCAGGKHAGYLTVKNCTFINCARVFNIPLAVRGQTEEGRIDIVGNTFYGLTGENRAIVQFSVQTQVAGGDYKYLDINFQDNNIVEMSTVQAGLLLIHTTVIQDADSVNLKADNITFSNNTVSSSIDTSKYVVNDDGKPNSDFDPYNIADFKAALLEKFIAGKK